MQKLVTIAGGGLAGLSCGIGLRRQGVPVELHEAGSYPRHRVCGEFVSGVSQQTLEELGITETLNDAAILRSMSWHSRQRKILTAKLPVPARGISRFTLDRRLGNLLQDLGGTVREKSRLKPSEVEGTLWCAGRERHTGGYVGIKAHFENLPLESDLEMHMGRGGYIGLCKVEDNRVNACGLFPESATRGGSRGDTLQKALSFTGLDQLARRLGAANLREGSLVGVAGFRPGWESSSRVSLGDSLAAIPPFTGNGMSMAMECAATSVPILKAWHSGRLDWDSCMDDIRKALHLRFQFRMRLALMIHPFLTHPAGQYFLAMIARSGLLPVQHVFRLLR